MSGGERRLSADELTDEQVEAIINTRGFRKMLAYDKLAEGIAALEERDEIFDSLVTNIQKQHTTIKSESSVQEVLDLFREEVEAFTEPLVDADDGGQDVDLEELYVEDEEGDDAE